MSSRAAIAEIALSSRCTSPGERHVLDLTALACREELVEPVERIRLVAVAAAVVDRRRDQLQAARAGDLLQLRPRRRRLCRRQVRLRAEVRLIEAEQEARALRN